MTTEITTPEAPVVLPKDNLTVAIGEPVVDFENRFMSLRTTPVEFPGGAQGKYSVLTSGNGLGSVVIPLVRFRGQDYMGVIEIFRFPTGEMSLEFPRGGTADLSSGEAARELLEETGLVAEKPHRIGTLRPDTGILNTEVAVWRANVAVENFNPMKRDIVESEANSFRWMSHGELAGLLRRNKITCGMTLAAYAMLRFADMS